jgi:hypothetical protein
MKICIQFLPSLFQDAPNGLFRTSHRHINVPEISHPSGSSVPSAAENASDLTQSSYVVPVALVNKPIVSGLVRNLNALHLYCFHKINLFCTLYECKRAERCFTIDCTHFPTTLYAVLHIRLALMFVHCIYNPNSFISEGIRRNKTGIVLHIKYSIDITHQTTPKNYHYARK